ncbi:3444_t:CDS:2 [Ambispora gerdemannii]|uniref:2-oxoglutarate dehydrogenase, mitochondrial n=1 Tax=Ambispora gerdemannii TaxID=144530 RepID=A0A9N8YJX6_9GLOM|nr:3444_t:CDS:2 [Ambispora gerdemannii]
MSGSMFLRAGRSALNILRPKPFGLHHTSLTKLRASGAIPSLNAVRTKVSAVNSPYPQTSQSNDVFLQGSTAGYVDEMYQAWLKDPNSVHLSWQVYFRNMQAGVNPLEAFQPPPTLVHITTGIGAGLTPSSQTFNVTDHMKVQLIVRAYQVRGHQIAQLDPLGIMHADLDPSIPSELDPSYYGFTERDLDRVFTLGPGILPGFMESTPKMTLREIVEHCKKTYCKTIGIEYIHIVDRVQCDWIRSRMEIEKPFDYSKEEKHMILDRLIWSDSFERFVATKYPNEKRFGLEGCESLIPGMKALVSHMK